jgi:AmmeMemoRadiSam system protein B/AmmeMemoRadiSam system protein A
MVVIMALGTVALDGTEAAGPDPKVRPPYCAGSWYPGDKPALSSYVDELLDNAPAPSLSDKPLAVISPHAGYRYSAPVAAAGYRWLKGHTYKRVIVMAFSHRAGGSYEGVDVPSDLTAYETPLGKMPIDREVCDKLLGHPMFASHANIDRGEHSLELQVPFLQRTLPGAKLVPLLVGRISVEDYAKATQAILPWIDDDTLLVASSDFTHFGQRFGYVPFKDEIPDKLRDLGHKAAEQILECDFDGFVAHLDKTNDTICGRGPIKLLLRILSMQGGAKGTLAGFDTSGQQTGDWSNSVTYESIVFTRPQMTLSKDEQDALLKLARQTVTAYLTEKKKPAVDPGTLSPRLRADGACFVTLENEGELRGCIGNMTATGPLYESVVRNAVNACQDRRFVYNPVTASELNELHIEISYLTPMIEVASTDDIVVGRDGLMISQGPRRGVLLPQVAARRGWTRDQFLKQTCHKAGLSADAWKKPNTKIYSFRAEVFGEPESKPEVSAPDG